MFSHISASTPVSVAALSVLPILSCRPTSAPRCNVACCAEKSGQSQSEIQSSREYRISVIGAGVAGATCVARLRDLQNSATLPIHARIYDMGSRGPGGRASSRPVDGRGGSFSPNDKGGGVPVVSDPLVFDHGVQAFQVSDPSLESFLKEWISSGILAEWDGVFGELDSSSGSFRHVGKECNDTGFCKLLSPGAKLVGMPSMADFVKGVVENLCPRTEELYALDYKWGCRIEKVDYDAAGLNGRWALTSPNGDVHHCDAIICAGHAASFAANIAGRLPDSASTGKFAGEELSKLHEVSYPDGVCPLYGLMVAFSEPLGGIAPFDAAAVRASDDLVWVSRDSSKPGRSRTDGKELWVVLSSEAFARKMRNRPSWSKRPTEEHLQEVASELFVAFEAALHTKLPTPFYMHAQRWGAGLTRAPLGLDPPCVSWSKAGLIACGDWCGTCVSVQDAALSGLAAAEAVHEIQAAAATMRSLISVSQPIAVNAQIAKSWPVWTCAAWPDAAGRFQESRWWEAREGAMEERCLIFEGQATLFPDGGGPPVTIRKGDWVSFRKGFSCLWNVEEQISKHYNYYDADGKEWVSSKL